MEVKTMSLHLLHVISLSCYAQTEEANIHTVEAEFLKKAEENIEKHRKGNANIQFRTQAGDPIKGSEVEANQKESDFLIGCIIFSLTGRNLDDRQTELFKERFRELFNFAVFPFYWASYEPIPGMPQWQKMLPVIEWCKAHNIVTKGHPLVWVNRSSIPNWLSQFPVKLHEELLKSRVINVVSGFAGKINMWDVVNEFTHTGTWEYKHTRQRQYTASERADYVEKALSWAYTGNPKANLILNNFDIIPNADTFGAHKMPPRQRLIEIIKELEKRNAPISGLGLQAHEPRDEWYPPQKVWEAYDSLHELGYPLHITEFTPRSSGNKITGGWREGIWTQEAQTEYTEQLYRLSFGHPAVMSFNFWGLSDHQIWLSGGGLVDENYSPKPVFRRLKHLVREEWMTRNVSAQTDNNGAVEFRGFYGKYEITLKTQEGKLHTFNIHLAENEANEWQFCVG